MRESNCLRNRRARFNAQFLAHHINSASKELGETDNVEQPENENKGAELAFQESFWVQPSPANSKRGSTLLFYCLRNIKMQNQIQKMSNTRTRGPIIDLPALDNFRQAAACPATWTHHHASRERRQESAVAQRALEYTAPRAFIVSEFRKNPETTHAQTKRSRDECSLSSQKTPHSSSRTIKNKRNSRVDISQIIQSRYG